VPILRSFSELLQAAARPPRVTVAIAGADQVEVLEAAVDCRRRALAEPILVGPEPRIRHMAAEIQLDLAGWQVLDCEARAAAQTAISLVRSGRAQVAAKGLVSTPALLQAALDRDSGLRTGRLASHVGVFEIPGFPRLLCISDGGVVLFPTLGQKIEIIRNAIRVARALGIERPRVALLAGSNQVVADRPATCELASLAAMDTLWDSEGAWVDGPFTLDAAVDPAAAATAGRSGEVAGQADVLIGPTLESTNTMCKGITYFGRGQMAGLVVGTAAPLSLGSRSDPADTRLACIAIGVLMAKAEPNEMGHPPA